MGMRISHGDQDSTQHIPFHSFHTSYLHPGVSLSPMESGTQVSLKQHSRDKIRAWRNRGLKGDTVG